MTFKVVPHSVTPDTETIEVFEGDRLLCCIYPAAWGVKIVSRHMVGTQMIDGLTAAIFLRIHDPQNN